MGHNLPFDIDALLVFAKVLECRSLSKAASLLGMPKSTVSRKISKLESDLGIRLLRKNTHQITVTDLGEKIYGHARSVGVDIESVSEVEGDSQPWLGKDQTQRAFKPYAVRISTECTYAELVRLLRELEKNNPHMFITDIDVNSHEPGFIKHTVSLVVEWPSWKSTERISAFTTGGEPAAETVPPAGG